MSLVALHFHAARGLTYISAICICTCAACLSLFGFHSLKVIPATMAVATAATVAVVVVVVARHTFTPHSCRFFFCGRPYNCWCCMQHTYSYIYIVECRIAAMVYACPFVLLLLAFTEIGISPQCKL